MKNLWKILFKNRRILYSAIFLGFSIAAVPTGAEAKNQKNNELQEENLDDMDFIELLHSVDVGDASELIQKFQAKEGKTRLLNGKYSPQGECTVEAYRNKEVLLLTIPAHLLFGPNMTELKAEADEYLLPIKRYLKHPDTYRVLLVMHTDNTGSEAYREDITRERVESVYEWFETEGSDTSYLFSFALSDDMPLYPNNSMENRDRNRRLEIYLVPGRKMVEQAKSGRIAF